MTERWVVRNGPGGHHREVHRRRAAAAAITIAVALAAGQDVAPTRASHSANALLPDLAVLPPSDFRIVVRDSGRRLLRFTTVVVNIGRGPLQLLGFR